MTQRAIHGEYLYFVTANVQNRRWFFVTQRRADKLGQAIQICCKLKHFDLLAYCILPNHVHLLVRKLSEEEVKQRLGVTTTSQRKLGSMRCEGCEGDNGLPKNSHLFLYRRLPSRRSVTKPYTLSDLMHSIKSTFSQSLHQGKFWQHRSNFRIIENKEYFCRVVDYIQYNYRKMKLDENYGRSPFMFIDWDVIQRTVG